MSSDNESKTPSSPSVGDSFWGTGCLPLIVIVFVIFMVVVTLASFSKNVPSSPTSAPSTAPSQDGSMHIGDDVVVALPGNSDKTQIIMIGSTKAVADEIQTALVAKDYLGMVQIPGAFAVSNGTKAKLIDLSFPLREVRIMEGNQFGKGGWLPMEFVTK